MDDKLKETLFSCFFDESEESVVGLDSERIVRTWSRGAEAFLDIPREEAIGRGFASFFSDNQECEKALEAARGVSLLKNYEARMVRGDGSREKVFLTVHKKGNKPDVFLVEISPAVVDFDVLPEHRTIQQTLVRMERFSAVGRMAASFAHEMRTPLHVISSTAEFGLEFLSPDSKMKENLEMILRTARHAALSVRALLDFAKVGKSHLREGSINHVTGTVLGLIEKMCQKQKIRLEVRLGKVPTLLIDEQPMRTVIHNLLVNAMEAMPDGGSLRVVTERAKDGGASLIIEDSGAGMAPEVLAKVGAPFFTTKEDGTGLGLYLAKRVLAEHGASIAFDSRQGRGAVVTVHFASNGRTS